jgi:hypothetical protein
VSKIEAVRIVRDETRLGTAEARTLVERVEFELHMRSASAALTVRDRFAMAALTGILAKDGYGGTQARHVNVAREAYEIADATMWARAKS